MISDSIRRQIQRAVKDIESRPPSLRGPFTMKQRYAINWRIEGTFEVRAASAEGAQAQFDKAWGSSKGILPMRDGEVSNDCPEVVKA